MSREDVELVRRGLDAFRTEGIEGWLEEFVAPDAVYVQDTTVAPDARVWHGWDGWRGAVDAWTEEFDEWSVEFDEPVDAGDGRVLVPWVDRGRGRRSGVVVERPRAAFLHTIRDRRITHTVQYGRLEDALEAAGLRGDI